MKYIYILELIDGDGNRVIESVWRTREEANRMADKLILPYIRFVSRHKLNGKVKKEKK